MEISKKKVLFCITKGNFGGAQKYVFDLATNLPKKDFEVVVACGTKEGRTLVDKLSEKNIRTLELESSEREINFKKDLKTIRELVRIIREDRPDVIHLNSSKIGLLGVLAVLYLRLLNLFEYSTPYTIPLTLFTAHGWAFNESTRSNKSKLIFLLGHYVTVLLSGKTIAVSEKTKNDIAWLPFIKNKILVIHNGIHTFRPIVKKEAREILDPTNSNRKVFVSISELHDNKGIDIAIKAIALLPKEKKEKILYCVIGEGEERHKLENLIEANGLKNDVSLLGFILDAKKLLSGADIFLFPSRNENLPFAILEAGSLGLPVISTSAGGIPEIIKDMKNGILVHPRNVKELSEAISYILDHPEKQKEFGKEIKKTVTDFFSLDKMISETTKVYNQSN